MTETDLRDVLREFSGGSDVRYRHPLNKNFQYTEGVRAMAINAGAYWLLDVAATEVAALVTERNRHSLLKFYVNGSTGLMELTFDDREKDPWRKLIPYTDFPEGTWVFEVTPDGMDGHPSRPIVMSLIEEH